MENYTFINNAKEEFKFFLDEENRLSLNIRINRELLAAFILDNEEKEELIEFLKSCH